MDCGEFIRKNTTAIKFNKIYCCKVSPKKYFLRFGESIIKFYTKFEKFEKLIGDVWQELSNVDGELKEESVFVGIDRAGATPRINKKNKYNFEEYLVKGLKPSVAFYRYDTYEKKTKLLEIRVDK